MKNQKKGSGSSSSRITDARFASFETDPRFRLPSKKRTKTTLDKRFAGMLDDEDFTATAKVDRYGRKIKSDSKKKALQRLYQPEEDEDEDPSKSEEDEKSEVDDDEVVQRELRAAEEKEKEKPKDYDPARHGGFASSESDSDSDEDSDEEEEEGGVGLATEGEMQKFQDEQVDVETGEVTNRIAIVNLDWDHVKSTDLMALFASFLPESEDGRILKISVYPSEFGKGRMQQEEVEGPPKALFKNDGKDSDDSSDDGSDSEDEKIKKELMQEGDDQDFDSDALRAYQLDRLRYYYAVMVCSSPKAAQTIYEATDGTEYQSSSNVIDLRFIPDDVTFDDEPRDECDKIPDTYKPVEFVTNALQSSKVKLTWDMHPEEASRKESINRAFTGSRANLEENDLRAYLASDSEDDGNDVEEVNAEAEEDAADEPKLSKKELARRKMREALGLAEEAAPKKSKDGPVGDMQITFTSALSNSKAKDADQEETTIEKYKRKEKERKDKKRQAAKAKRAGISGEDADQGEDDLPNPAADDDLGFDDPFFTTEDTAAPSKTSIRKEERLKKRQAREEEEAESAAAKAHLTKVMAEDSLDNQVDHLDHFDMNEIMRAEKKKSKKGKKGKKGAGDIEDRGGLQEDFSMDLEDERFKAVFDSHEFAIDPSNPKFKATSGMKKLLEEGRKKRRGGDGDDEPRRKKIKKGRR
ncbi:pre-rRNA processing protein Esf1 [Pochonia chlamydosporia 170]|uniref:Pre-rRNA processing protein Esf1 n=1 Tax=Pochonia chlamydosporia 170 TaxID=1380566 RepID=A0A179FL10_METCM|nr:pre-rRNA processing protein Esf1 [Pochonia chlamydosporia 170]OAQ65997.1 pre-rRNA processing protein Esf1 [Pochonia chlamydosporia 170]